MLLASSALALGFVHGLGADHLMAIAALSVRGRDERLKGKALGVALRFACGHALLLGAGAAAVVLAGWEVPSALERGGELVSGWLLIALGGTGAWALVSGEVSARTRPRDDSPRVGFGLHGGDRHRHQAPGLRSHVPPILGAIFAVSSLRTLTLFTSVGGVETVNESLLALLGFVTVFAGGIMLAMCSFGVLLAQLLSSRMLFGVSRLATGATATASIILGIYWITSS